ncbi:hypothetical protein BN7_1319 [Wickerhamomyces ciferrii]|uniref:Uncharacterized protein n=1 Tax=Wickerhamomyces ciferrii (strain ATCC 14091 / BCRC 22168 / CBS 111 / JCM 3599 / NBRC 0793 / NRRL Y-1031 F-60-10) TaxID=1206466 RepID=K0KA38_WICCF|nr:uncharacterized protein BN7_1319 [Wickerhamomyces ciferrii]CCH41780.1 hypothetical protein BN7_1319 [Wickerhamomyces ciferrii]
MSYNNASNAAMKAAQESNKAQNRALEAAIHGNSGAPGNSTMYQTMINNNQANRDMQAAMIANNQAKRGY